MLAYDCDAVLVERIQTAISKEIEARSKSVAGGQCKTLDDYTFQCGIIAGLKSSTKFSREEYKAMNKGGQDE